MIWIQAQRLGDPDYEVLPELAIAYAWMKDEERSKDYETKAERAIGACKPLCSARCSLLCPAGCPEVSRLIFFFLPAQ